MNVKTYLFLRLLIIISLAMIVSSSIILGNFFLPVVAMIAAMLFLWASKKKVKAILHDEFDYKVAGDSARYSIFIYTIISAVLGIYFMASRGQNQNYELLGSIFSYSACFLLILQSLIFKYLRSKNYKNIKNED